MLDKIVEKYMKKMIDEILDTPSDLLDEFLDYVGENVSEEEIYDLMEHFVATYLVVKREKPETTLESMMKDIIMDKERIYEFKAQLEETSAYRSVLISPYMTIKEFAIAILAAFGADMEHPFFVRYENRMFSLLDLDGAENLDLPLFILDLVQNDVLNIIYDLGEEYIINCELVNDDVMDEDSFDLPRVVDASGYGIWEDNKQLRLLLESSPTTRVENYDGRKVMVKTFAKELDIKEGISSEEFMDRYNSGLNTYEIDDDYEINSGGQLN